MKFFSGIIFACILLSTPAFADTLAVRDMDSFGYIMKLQAKRPVKVRTINLKYKPVILPKKGWPVNWSACKTSADCTIVSSSCGPSSGVNKRYQAKAQARICKKENCSVGCNASAMTAFGAKCEKNKCVPDYSVKQPPVPEVQYKLGVVGLSEPRCNDGPCNGKAWITHTPKQ